MLDSEKRRGRHLFTFRIPLYDEFAVNRAVGEPMKKLLLYVLHWR